MGAFLNQESYMTYEQFEERIGDLDKELKFAIRLLDRGQLQNRVTLEDKIAEIREQMIEVTTEYVQAKIGRMDPDELRKKFGKAGMIKDI